MQKEQIHNVMEDKYFRLAKAISFFELSTEGITCQMSHSYPVFVHNRRQNCEGRAGLSHNCNCNSSANSILPFLNFKIV